MVEGTFLTELVEDKGRELGTVFDERGSNEELEKEIMKEEVRRARAKLKKRKAT